MRTAVSAVFFLVMAPLGLMATELQTAGHRTSNVQGTVAVDDAEQHHLQGNLRRGSRGLDSISQNMSTLLQLHNEARCKHNANSLTYSSNVAASAAAHAQVLSSSCGDFYHSASADRNGYGENLFLCWGTGSKSCYTPEGAMSYLYESEVQANSVTQYGGHATQILWKSTTQLGCAEATCTANSRNYVYLVCQYNPAGNYVGRVEQEVDLPTGTNC